MNASCASAAAGAPSALGAGAAGRTGGAPAGSWAEGFVARRDAARAFLAGLGMAAYRQDRPLPDAHAALNTWKVPGYSGAFLDGELIAIAVEHGFDG
jgi:hypothetical protein